jgi:hypothetical protein
MNVFVFVFVFVMVWTTKGEGEGYIGPWEGARKVTNQAC